MNLAFYGGKQAGLITLLSIVAKGHKIAYVFPEDEIISNAAKMLDIPILDKTQINSDETLSVLKDARVKHLVCCHGKRIIRGKLLSLGCLNLHPCLYRYKGKDPIVRLIADNNRKASVGVHWMSEKIDEGDVIVELYKEVELDSVIGVYNQLYPLYAEAAVLALERIK
jgi:methionyl-tRNA formyltransferase